MSRRPGTILRRRFALVAALTLGLLGGPGALALADQNSGPIVQATVYSSSGVTQDSVTLATLQSSPQCPQYSGQSMQELGRQGMVDVSLPPAGQQTGTWALSTILECLQTPIAPSTAKAITIFNNAGAPELGPGSQLTPADLTSPSDFNDASEVPVVSDLGSSNQYDRPWRGNVNGRPDYDYLDEVTLSQPLTIDVFEGGRLAVTASASHTTVGAGTPVNFSASVSPPSQPGLSYSWTFDGGAPNSTVPAPSATFATLGTYAVRVQVTDAAGAGGFASIPITVGTAPSRTGTHPHGGNGTKPSATAPSGPQRSGGAQPGAPAGSKHPGGGGKHDSSGHVTTSTRGGTSGRSGATGASRAAGTSRPSRGASRETPHSTVPVRAPSSHARTLPIVGPVVAGLLISDVTPLPSGVSPLVRSVPASISTAPPVREAVRAPFLPVLGAALAVFLLLGLGAGRELRGRRRWRTLGFGA